MKAKIDYSIYLVTDEVALKGRELLPVVEEALQNGVDKGANIGGIHLRLFLHINL